MATLSAIFIASLFGSLHCAGMCGPLVAFAMGATPDSDRRFPVGLQFAYHGGRLISYALLGVTGGLLGAALDLGGGLLGLQRAAAVVAGSMMVVAGIVAILRYRGVRLAFLHVPSFLERAVMLGRRAAMRLGPLPRALTIGLLTALLPCGWLYAFVIVAAGTSHAAWGAAIMIAFWLGTVPILAGLGVGIQAFTGTLGRRVPLVTALTIVLLGLFTIGGRMAISLEKLQSDLRFSTGGTDAVPIQHVKQVQETTLPCCETPDE